MAMSKQAIVLLPPVLVPAGGTKASPNVAGIGAAIDCRTYYGGDVSYKITNGASAPGNAANVTFQTSPDGTRWADYASFSGDTTANSAFSNTIMLDPGIMYLRVIVWNHTTNSVTVESDLQAIVSL